MSIEIKDIKAVLPGESGFEVRECSVFIAGDTIASVGEKPEGFTADTIINGKGKLLIPGLINGHTHVYMTIFRNYADDLAFSEWLFDNILPLEDKLLPEDSYWGTMLGYMEMLKTGTTCSLDMYITAEQAVKAQQDTGIRAVMSRGLSGSFDEPSGGIRRLNEAVNEIEKWRNAENITFMLGPHAPYTCDPGYLTEIAAEAKRLNVGMNIHISESRDEIATIKEKYGCTPVEMLDKYGVLRDNTVAAHCVFVTDSDIDIFKQRGVSVASNPVSNLKLGNGIAPVPELIEKGVNVCIGTDGTASNNALNMFRDLNYLTLLHKGVREDATVISAQQGLYIATQGGAKALGLEGITGRIESGMKADLAVLDLNKPWMQPENNLISALAYSANGSEVETVIVNGKILLKDGEFTAIDAERVYFETEKICKRIGMR